VLINLVVDNSKFTGNNTSATGPTMNTLGTVEGWANFTTPSGGALIPMSAGTYTNTFSWIACSSPGGATATPFVYLIALKGPATAQAKKIRIQVIRHKKKKVKDAQILTAAL
jgi:hypothetical protein